MVRSLVNTAKKVRPYVMLIAYGIVLSDVLNLAQEVTQEFVLNRFFPEKEKDLYEEYAGKMENNVEQMSRDEILPEKRDIFSEMVNFSNHSENITKVEIE